MLRKMMLKKILVSCFLIPHFFATTVSAAEVKEFNLDNGLKLIVQEDHRSPVVVSQVWYRAGAMDEVNGKTGVAHVLEHMMFKGTKKVPGGQFSRMIAAAGGKENAFTSADFTCYFQQLEKSHLPLSFKLEADRMANLIITEEEFKKEIKVVMEERRWRTDDKPQAMLNEAHQAAAYTAHPYGRPIVGFMNDLENMTYEDAQNWYNDWYAPNNAIVVVVGDVKANEVYQLANQYFGPLKEKILPIRKPQIEPKQLGERRVVVKAPAKLPSLQIGFHVPAIKNAQADWEPYALEVLAGVLSGNAAARLNQNLVRTSQVAISADAGYGILSRGRLAQFELYATPSKGKTVADMEEALFEELDKIKQTGVTIEELNRVKAGVIASEVYQRDSMFYQGMQMGTVETAGFSWKILDIYPTKIRAVTSAQVQAVAKRYLIKDNMTAATLDPQPLDPNAKPKGQPHMH
jgi:zinc protease